MQLEQKKSEVEDFLSLRKPTCDLVQEISISDTQKSTAFDILHLPFSNYIRELIK
jgi:hypothetical protein